MLSLEDRRKIDRIIHLIDDPEERQFDIVRCKLLALGIVTECGACKELHFLEFALYGVEEVGLAVIEEEPLGERIGSYAYARVLIFIHVRLQRLLTDLFVKTGDIALGKYDRHRGLDRIGCLAVVEAFHRVDKSAEDIAHRLRASAQLPVVLIAHGLFQLCTEFRNRQRVDDNDKRIRKAIALLLCHQILIQEDLARDVADRDQVLDLIALRCQIEVIILEREVVRLLRTKTAVHTGHVVVEFIPLHMLVLIGESQRGRLLRDLIDRHADEAGLSRIRTADHGDQEALVHTLEGGLLTVRAERIELLTSVDEGGRELMSALTGALEDAVFARNQLIVQRLAARADVDRQGKLSFACGIVAVCPEPV